MRLAAAALGTLAWAVVSGAMAQTPPEGVVWMALNDINAAGFDPDDPTNRPPLTTAPPEGMIRAVEVNGDGRPDWLVDYSRAGLSHLCGTGGCLRRLYVSGGDTGYRRVFDALALSLEVVERDGEARVDAWVHHLNCRIERSECWFSWAWDDEQARLVERPARDGATVLAYGGFQPIDIDNQNLPDILPEELANAWFGGRLTCRDYSDNGSSTLRPTFQTIPDINGDGRHDWIETPAQCLEDESGQRFRVWATVGGGTLAMVYESARGAYPAVDIGTTLAGMLENPGCEGRRACPDRRLRWDDASGRLVP